MKEETKDLKYWKLNAEEDYIKTPISVLRYISELEKSIEMEKEQIGYSEDEVLQLLLKLQQTESYDNLYDWFQQNKKH